MAHPVYIHVSKWNAIKMQFDCTDLQNTYVPKLVNILFTYMWSM